MEVVSLKLPCSCCAFQRSHAATPSGSAIRRVRLASTWNKEWLTPFIERACDRVSHSRIHTSVNVCQRGSSRPEQDGLQSFTYRNFLHHEEVAHRDPCGRPFRNASLYRAMDRLVASCCLEPPGLRKVCAWWSSWRARRFELHTMSRG